MKTKKPRWRILRWVLPGIVCVLIVAVAGTAWWLRPFPASAQAMDALHSGDGITVTTTNETITFMPKQQHPVEGIIFYPGARVDPDAYARYMRTFAEHGYEAFIVKMPLNIALLGENLASDVIAANPTIKSWVIGGHSLGGVAACSFALHNVAIKGLLLYASYPNEDLSKQTRLHIVSISGTNDGLATPAKIAAAKPLLPATTVYVSIQGGVHAFFGDYGPQDGDGNLLLRVKQLMLQLPMQVLRFWIPFKKKVVEENKRSMLLLFSSTKGRSFATSISCCCFLA